MRVDKFLKETIRLINEGKVVSAVMLVRTELGLPLREARDIVHVLIDALLDAQSKAVGVTREQWDKKHGKTDKTLRD